MLKTLKIIAAIVVVVVAGILIYAATKPDTFRVQRTVDIKAPPDKIFPLVNDLTQSKSWSPYEKKDPAMKRTYGAITAGKGATYAWDGNDDVGQGSMEIVESAAPSKVVMKLDFIKPFEGHNMAEFALEPKGDVTSVTWAIYGPCPYISKVISTFIDVDGMIGKDFEKGLADMKAVAEKQ